MPHTQIKLLDLLRLKGVDLRSYRIHLATASGPGPGPLTLFHDKQFNASFQGWQSKQFFRAPHILSLIDLGRRDSRWLFAGVHEVLGAPKRFDGPSSKWFYDLKELAGLEDIVGRLIVHFPWKARARVLLPSSGEKLMVDQILPAPLSCPPFPGFANLHISLRDLRLIVREKDPVWQAALSSVGAIYLIMDRSCGKQYVGSAYGTGGLWQRWSQYAASGHGGNVALQRELGEKGEIHAEHFQFAILEIIGLAEPISHFLHREGHWKDALGSRVLGYNIT